MLQLGPPRPCYNPKLAMVDQFFNITCGMWVPIVRCINQWWKHIQIDYLFVMGIDPLPQNCSHIDSLKMEKYATSFPFGLAM